MSTKSTLSTDEQLERLEAIKEETCTEKVELGELKMTARGRELYERFRIARDMHRKWEEEEDDKIRAIFVKLGKEQAEKAVEKAENELYNKEDEEQLIRENSYQEKSGLEQAFEEMVMVKKAYDEAFIQNQH